jgi:hypothetical protein
MRRKSTPSRPPPLKLSPQSAPVSGEIMNPAPPKPVPLAFLVGWRL